MFVYSALSYTSLPSARLKGCFRVFLANVSYFKDKGRYLLEFKIRLRYGRYLLVIVRDICCVRVFLEDIVVL
jgi:hypothetical protein